MYPLFESIKVVDDQIFHFDEHYLRMQNSSKALWHHQIHFPHLENEICQRTQSGLQKCKIIYNENEYRIEVQPYHKRAIERIYLVENNRIEYPYKYTNRKQLLQLLDRYEFTDEIILVQNKNLTDTTYSNIALWNGVEWHTPKKPLFKGIKRKILLEQNLIKEKIISINDIDQYSKISLINAMLDLCEIEIKIENVIR
ncbi:MAG TPA: aminotransferase class IV [Chitinophagaceae bacterium]|nr:aminotransferase class IV [Chitinophagaceae bacterium]